MTVMQTCRQLEMWGLAEATFHSSMIVGNLILRTIMRRGIESEVFGSEPKR